jgi:hypothetical protein
LGIYNNFRNKTGSPRRKLLTVTAVGETASSLGFTFPAILASLHTFTIPLWEGMLLSEKELWRRAGHAWVSPFVPLSGIYLSPGCF